MSSLDAITGADTMRSVHTEASTHDHTGRPTASRVSATGYSRIGIAGALLPLCARRASTFLPTFPRPGFANRASHGRGRSGTMRALTPGSLATRPPGLSAYPALPSGHPVPNHAMPSSRRFHSHLSATGQTSRSRLRHAIAGSPGHTAESGSFSYGLPIRRRLLPTPPHDDAVAFGYMCSDFT